MPNLTLQMKKISRLFKQKMNDKRTEDLEWIHKREQCICSAFISSNIFQTEKNLYLLLYKQKIIYIKDHKKNTTNYLSKIYS